MLECPPPMTVPTPAIPASPPAGFDLVVSDASWVWSDRRFRPLADHEGMRVLLIKACDWRNARQQRFPWRDWAFPLERLGPNLWQLTCVLPPGWMKSYPILGMKPIAWAVNRWRESLGVRRPLGLAISYPYYLYLRDLLKPEALFYYNMDDYALYWASKRESVRLLEERAVREADLSVVCALERVEALHRAVPEAAARVVHLPHGAPASAIGSYPQHAPASPPIDIAHLPRPLLGFVGSLEDRLDWDLVGEIAGAFPGGSVVLLGREPADATGEGWYDAYRRAAALPNVHRLGWRTQAEIARYNAAFDVCLIPYLIDHPFNRASCPTKVMDYMATSRPVVTTALPECRLYSHLFDIAETPAAFIEAVKKVVACGSDDGKALLRWEFARAATWERSSASMLQLFREATRGKL